MKKIDKIKNSINIEKFTLLDVIFLVIIFSLLSITITTFIYRKNKLNSVSTNIDNVYNEIINSYYEDVDKEELANSAIKGMMSYLDETYSTFMGDQATNNLTEELNGTYKGIGVVVQQKDEGLFIYNIFKNSPADEGGLQVGDQLIKVDEIDVSTSDLTEVVKYIQSHDSISFVIRRNSSDLVININTTDIDNPVVSSKLLTDGKDNYGYIYLGSFSKTSSTQFNNALEELEKNDIKGLIIDLRNNRGGYVDQAVNITKLFTNKNKILYRVKDKNKEEVFKDDDDIERKYPIVVLINSGTASSSELLTLALKESYGAITVGTTSYGKGRIQETSNLTDTTMIKLTTGRWYSPNNNNIDGVGIKPAYEVELSDKYFKDPTDANDNQLTKGLSVLVGLNK